MCERKVFEKPLNKVTKKNIFSVNENLYKQVDGMTMGGPLSVVFANCFLNKMEHEVVNPTKPIFHRRYVDDTYIKKKEIRKHSIMSAPIAQWLSIRLII